MTFLGHFDYSLDAKNRLNIPPQYRPVFSDGVVLMKWFEPCIAIFTPSGFQEFTKGFLPDLNPVSDERRRLARFVGGGAFNLALDSAGRVTLAAPLLEHAGLGKDVVMVGSIDYLEVWDRDRYRAERDELAGGAANEIAKGLGHPS